MTPLVYVQLRRTKDWRMPAGTVICDRRGPWGNPWRVTQSRGRWWALGPIVEDDRAFLTEAEALAYAVKMCGAWAVERFGACPERLSPLCGPEVTGLACWCAPGAPCHVQDVLLPMVNRLREKLP